MFANLLIAESSLCVAVQSGLINSFPFDPMGQNSKDMAVKEIKNGRLAMVSRQDMLEMLCAVQTSKLEQHQQR